MYKKSNIIVAIAILVILFEIGFIAYHTGLKSAKPKVDIIYDTSILDSYIKLQTEYDKLLAEYTTFSHHLETYGRGVYDGYMAAKGIEEEE